MTFNLEFFFEEFCVAPHYRKRKVDSAFYRIPFDKTAKKEEEEEEGEEQEEENDEERAGRAVIVLTFT